LDRIEKSMLKLDNARSIFREAGIKFGIAKCLMSEAELVIDLLHDKCTTYGFILSKTEIDIINRLKDAISLFEELEFSGLHARAFKFSGLLWSMKYSIDDKKLKEQEKLSSLDMPIDKISHNPV
jgi:hypothetical protein